MIDHHTLGAIKADLAPVIERFSEAGHRLYLVGGAVRDLVLGRSSDDDDIDLTTDAPPEVTRHLLTPLASAVWTQGERFGTIGARVAGRPLEVTTHRAESYDPDSRKPQVAFGDDVVTDLSRRDFTVNAMAYDLVEDRLIDPFGGVDDLAAGRLRTPLDPVESFSDDPLRMLRAARFVARYRLEPDPALVAVAAELADRLAIVSAERVHDELERLLAVPDPGAGLDLLATTGLIERILPEVAADGELPDPRFAGRPRGEVVRRTLPGIGSPAARRGLLLWPSAEVGGEERVEAVARRLRYSVQDRRATAALAGALQRLLADRRPAPEVVRRAADRLGPGHEGLWELAGTLALGGAAPATAARLAELAAAGAELARRGELDRLQPPIGGDEVMERLGCGPGPVVGQALEALRQAVLSDGPFDRAEALRRLDDWWRDRPG